MTRFHIASDVDGPLVNFEIEGLDDDDSPFMTIKETCARCGWLVASTDYDARDKTFDPVALGAANATRFEEHWKAAHS